MLMGTGSDVGKSVLTAGLCRAFTRKGLSVAPFKPQNMSNNAAVTADGGEIGRAQALQALACRRPLSVHMNPVLLKPQGADGSQIIVQGKIFGQAKARGYQAIKPTLLPRVIDSFNRLRGDADLVLIEGAGSAAEVNLRTNDIANMGFAEAVDAPVVIVGDIDRGGVIASVVGIKHVLEAADVARIKGFIINKMRGDASLFADGMAFIAERTGWAKLGLVSFFEGANALPSEDSLGLGTGKRRPRARLKIAVLAYPRISNFDDLDPLIDEDDVDVAFIRPGEDVLHTFDVIVLPGSKATIDDLAALRQSGWDKALLVHVARGGQVIGLCGGYQMLGQRISDPDGMEGPVQSVEGLGLLAIETVLSGEKTLIETQGYSAPFDCPVAGYEMHVGRTTGADTSRPFAMLGQTADGAMNGDGRVFGTYLHGVFSAPTFRRQWLGRFGVTSNGHDHRQIVDAALDSLADHLEDHLDMAALAKIAGL
jgi:adenosylcobyric acid synthase